MKTLREVVKNSLNNKVAIGHFNTSNLEALRGIFNAAKALNLPVIIAVSEGERDFFGIKQFVAVIKSLREEYDYPVFAGADHTYSFERFKEAVDAGFDSVIFDGTELSLDENIKITKKCVDYAKSVNPEIIVEGELGFIGTSSKILDEIPKGVKIGEEYYTKVEDAVRFVKETGVDMFAPAVGNVHGMLKAGGDPHLDIERVKAIAEAVKIPLVLHGGSGTPKEDVVLAIKSGVAIVHVNTEIRTAYKKGLMAGMAEFGEEIAPYKFLKQSILEVQKVVTEKLKLFNS
ncbi:class II fructose-bisphosphate aldolase [Candidatus Nomurabacteria bacterium]|nr:class II fructose-bisphosphate aldolase [Candidatus Nomurabacteria bacterium]